MEENTDLKIKNLHKVFGKNKVLNGIDFELKEGERVVILGPSGSGKSTFLRCINWMEEPTSGEIYLDGVLVTEKNIRKIRRNIGMVFQHFNLINNLTVMDNLILAPMKLKLMKRAEAEKRAKELLKHIGLLDKADSFPASLSGGQKQRLSIARAIATNPDIYIFDDSFSALDFKTDAKLRNDLKKVTKNKTVLIVAQRISTIMNADQIVVMDEGNVVGIGTHNELMKNCKVYKEIALSQLSKEELANE